MELLIIFSNREIAAGLWLLVFIGWSLCNESVRKSFIELLKTFCAKPIIIIFVLMSIYIFMIVILLNEIGLWSIKQLKNTIMWSVSVASVMLFRINSISEDENYFKNALLDNLKIVVVLEFIVNVNSLNLLLELILVPITAILGGMLAIAESNDKFLPGKKLITAILSTIGIGLLSYSIYEISQNFYNFATKQNILDFILPIIMSSAYLPFVYFMALFMTYEVLFIRLSFFVKDANMLKYAKRATLRNFNINLSKLKRWAKHICHVDFTSTATIDRAIVEFNMND